jgi:hypothetical protein
MYLNYKNKTFWGDYTDFPLSKNTMYSALLGHVVLQFFMESGESKLGSRLVPWILHVAIILTA